MPVVVSNVKAADPGVAFTLEVPANEPPLENSIRAVVTITDPTLPSDPIQIGGRSFTSEVWARDPISNRIMKCMAPFGDNAYAPGRILKFSIDLYIPCDADRFTIRQEGEVMSTSGRFDLGSDMIVRVQDAGGLHIGPSTTIMPMMESEDGNFIGIIHPDGNFIIFPQYVFGEDKMEPTYTSDTKAVGRINGHPVSIYVSNGRAYIFSNNQNLFVSQEQLVGSDLVILRTGFYLKKTGTPLILPEEIGPLTFEEVW